MLNRKHIHNSWLLKTLLATALVIGAGLVTVVALSSGTRQPLHNITGEWKELMWEYERVNKGDTGSVPYTEINDEVKALIGEKLVIHRAEAWHFLPNGQLKLKGRHGEKTVRWKLSGRGHILELKDGRTKEDYNVIALNDSLLVINFDTDLEVRGIARLTFIKTHN